MKAKRKTGQGGLLRKITPILALIAAILGAACIFAEAWLARSAALSFSTGIKLLAGYVAVLVLTLLLLLWIFSNRGEEEDVGNGAVVLQRLPLPLLICRQDGKVIFRNQAWQALPLTEKEEAAERHPFSAEQWKILTGDSDAGCVGCELRYAGGLWRARVFPMTKSEENEGDHFYAIVLEDWQAEARRRMENPVVAYVAIDNVSDVLRMSGADSHQLFASIGEELNRFTASVDGVLLEMDRGRYFVLFNEDQLQKITAGRHFPLLQQIESIHTGGENSTVTVTASIGVGEPEGSLAKRAQSAQMALDRATQDGGACAVVKRAGERYDSYRGNTKAIHSTSRERSRIEGEKLLREIGRAKNVLIMGHSNPDYDCLAAAVAVARIALYKGVPAYIALDRSEGNVGSIKRALPLLREIPDMGSVIVTPEEAQDHVCPDSLLVIVDVNSPQKFEMPELEKAVANVAYIDHHRRNMESWQPNKKPVMEYIDSQLSSASEMLTGMIEVCLPRNLLTPRERELLMAGIILDTKRFTVNPGPGTFAVAQYLNGLGVDPLEIQSRFFPQKMEEIRLQYAIEAKATPFHGVAIAAYDEQVDATEDFICAMAADHLLTLENMRAAVVLYRCGNTVAIKARSADKRFDVKILVGKMGGGHLEAAAGRMPATLREGMSVTMNMAVELMEKRILAYEDADMTALDTLYFETEENENNETN